MIIGEEKTDHRTSIVKGIKLYVVDRETMNRTELFIYLAEPPFVIAPHVTVGVEAEIEVLAE